eukprot:9429623-Pyramimonas_sp.AAC.1
MEIIDDDPARGNPRDAGGLSERIQYEFGQTREFQCTFVASDRSMSRQKRSPSRPVWRTKNSRDDDEDEERED